jgi:hypothetical protein
MWNHQFFQATNQWPAKNVSEHGHLYQDGNGDLESYFSGSDEGGCCTANNGQGWPKYVLRSVYRTPADGGIAVGAFVPLRVQLGVDSVLLVDTDYPFEDSVAVLLTNLKRATPLRVRVPGWAPRATATLCSDAGGCSAVSVGHFLCLITPPHVYLHGGLYGGLYERAHIIRCFPPRGAGRRAAAQRHDAPRAVPRRARGRRDLQPHALAQPAAPARLRRGSFVILPPHFIWRFPIRGANFSDE